jgi:hypothetical protein
MLKGQHTATSSTALRYRNSPYEDMVPEPVRPSVKKLRVKKKVKTPSKPGTSGTINIPIAPPSQN